MQIAPQSSFPIEFGQSIDEFLEQYERLIYKIILEKLKPYTELEPEEIFSAFFIHISENNFKRLRQFKGQCKPATFLVTLLRNFIFDLFRKTRVRASSGSLEELEEEKSIAVSFDDPENTLIAEHKSELILDALKDTFSQLSNQEKLIFDLTYRQAATEEKMKAAQVAEFMNVPVKEIYQTNAKTKAIFKNELQKRNIDL